MANYACADLHGCGNLWDAIKNFLQPDDKLYFLGDAIDRGPDGYRIMKEMLADPRVFYIMGNHEYMMINAIENAPIDFEIWSYNGCSPTYDAWIQDGRPMGIIRQLKSLPTLHTFVNKYDEELYLCHAGFNWKYFDQLDDYKLVWDRRHINQDNDIVNETGALIVHGHTPTPYLIDELQYQHIPFEEDCGVVCYNNKFDIDCGSVWTHRAALFDLDELAAIEFIEKGE